MREEKLIFWPMLGLVLLSPLPFASVLPWSWAVFGVLTGLIVLAWCAFIVFGRYEIPVPIRKIWLPAALFTVAVVWAVIQVAPFTPATWHHPIWVETAGALSANIQGRISVNPHRGGSALALLLAYGAVFWLALQFCRDRELAKTVLYAITFSAFAYAIYGLLIEFTGLNMVLWVEKRAYRESLTSTFINRNSYATFAGLGLICATAVIHRRMSKLTSQELSRREQLRLYLSRIGEREWVYFLVWLIIATALFLTDSRAGVVSACAGLLVFLGIVRLTGGRSSLFGKTVAATIIVALIFLFSVSGGQLSKRLDAISADTESTRPLVWAMALEAMNDAPLLGMGYGSYPDVFHLYRTEDSRLRTRVEKAHNTYLENALELGIPAAAALSAAIGVLAIVCLLGARRRRRDHIYPAAAVAATVTVGLHSAVDFSLQIPAVAATYCLILGAGCAQSWRSGT